MEIKKVHVSYFSHMYMYLSSLTMAKWSQSPNHLRAVVDETAELALSWEKPQTVIFARKMLSYR